MDRHEHGHPWAYGPPPWHHGFSAGPGPGTFFLTLSIVFWIALLIFFLWAAMKWILPSILPTITEAFASLTGSPERVPADVSAFEILRQRYAAGEIDAITFEQMWERLEASYQHEEQRPPFDMQPGARYRNLMHQTSEEHGTEIHGTS
ncbi:MAG: hypothetical protein ABI456_10350 [Ktedonobacteraceae bacterium]|nr:hypothetical protein [Chloroflexota bacterium]